MIDTIRFAALVTAVVAAPVFAEGGTPKCDALEDGLGMRAGFDSNIDFNGEDLVFRDNGETFMIITEDRQLFLHGERVELDERGRELVDRYYVTVEAFVDDAVDLAGDAAGFGLSAAMEALAAVFRGEAELDATEKRIEARAREIEAQANSMCERFWELEGIEREMQDAIPGFEPVLFAVTE